MKNPFTLSNFYKVLSSCALSICLLANVKAQVSGKVFRDFNANGLHTTVAPDPIEPGLKDVTVNAYDNTNALFTATTDATGNYSIAGGVGPYRVEFITPAFYYASKGSSSNTTVQFVAAGATADLGVNYPGDYCQANPSLVIPNHDAGSGVGNTRIGFGLLHYDDSGKQTQYGGTTTNMTNDATVDQIGTVWGVAYQKKQKRVFTSAFLKRYAAFADGPGYVYVLDYASGTGGSIAHSFDLQGVSTASGGTIDLGTITRTNKVGSIAAGAAGDYELPSARNEPSLDLDAFGKVGTMSFGDNDLTEDEKTLWVVNLYQKSLIKIDVSNTTSTALPGAVDQFILSSLSGYPTANNGVLRPWGLKFYKGKGYLGVINDGSSGSRADLKAYVLSFDPNNIAVGFTTELDFSLNFAKQNLPDNWKPWITTWAETTNSSEDFKIYIQADGANIYAQPILSDIEFQPNGDMLLGFRDRLGDQFGQGYKAISGNREIPYNYSRGDLLKACKTASGFVIEGAGACPVNFGGAYGVSNNGEFFQDIIGDGAAEGLSGGLAILPGTNEVVSTTLDPKLPAQPGYDPTTVSSQGIHWNNLTSGVQTDWYQVEPQSNGGVPISSWAKANGLGDIELLCNAAPIEIGNRVFMDTNSDGIQDPNEMGVDGVVVKLYKAGIAVDSIPTANGGQWFFANLDAETNYEVKILSADIPSGKSLTKTDAGAGAAGTPEDMRDNDAILVGSDAVITYKTGNAGQNNHTLDFGLKVGCSLSATVLGTNPTCPNNDGAITLKVVGATGTPTYLWSNGAVTKDLSAIPAGQYTVTVTDGTCSTTATTIIEVIPSNIPYSICPGETYKLEIQDNTLTGIQWKKDGVDISGANALSYTATSVGVYTYTSNGVGGCAVGQCCPIELVASTNCCKPAICTTITITKK